MRAVIPDLTKPAVFTVDGDLAGAETSVLAEKLWPHLLTAPPTTVLDLSAADALDDAGVALLTAACTYTAHRGLVLSIINAAPGPRNALLAAGASTAPQDVPTPAPVKA